MSSSSSAATGSGRSTALALALAILLAGCGKKGDPLPPLLPIPRAAEDLTVQQRGPELILRFAYPQTTAAGLPLGELERIEVYELVKPALAAPLTPPAPAEAAPAGETVAAPGWLSPPIDAREFIAAAKIVLTLRAGDLAGAVRGDRLVVTLPQELPPPTRRRRATSPCAPSPRATSPRRTPTAPRSCRRSRRRRRGS